MLPERLLGAPEAAHAVLGTVDICRARGGLERGPDIGVPCAGHQAAALAVT